MEDRTFHPEERSCRGDLRELQRRTQTLTANLPEPREEEKTLTVGSRNPRARCVSQEATTSNTRRKQNCWSTSDVQKCVSDLRRRLGAQGREEVGLHLAAGAQSKSRGGTNTMAL
jgi:hypothetical protein